MNTATNSENPILARVRDLVAAGLHPTYVHAVSEGQETWRVQVSLDDWVTVTLMGGSGTRHRHPPGVPSRIQLPDVLFAVAADDETVHGYFDEVARAGEAGVVRCEVGAGGPRVYWIRATRWLPAA